MSVNLNGIELRGTAISAPGGSASKPATSADAPAGIVPAGAAPESEPQAGEVSITSTAALLANLQQSLSAQPAINQQRVATLSRALAAGTYVLDPARIASGVLSSERALSPLPLAQI